MGINKKMRSNRNKFEEPSYVRDARAEPREEKEQPRDYQYLTAKYGKYLDQSKLDQSKLDYSIKAEKIKDKGKENDPHSSFDEKDENDQLTGKQP